VSSALHNRSAQSFSPPSNQILPSGRALLGSVTFLTTEICIYLEFCPAPQQIPQRRLYLAVIGSPKANSLRASFRQNPTKENSAQMKRKRFSVEQIVAVLKQVGGSKDTAAVSDTIHQFADRLR
jgi:hypothetical protein